MNWKVNLKVNPKTALLLLPLLSWTPGALAQSSSSAEITASNNYTLELKGKDAKALFIRLERKENKNDGLEDTRTKVGQALLCNREKEGIFKKARYTCALSFKVANGELHEMYPIGETDDKAGLKKEKEYQGTLVAIKDGSADAVVRVIGSPAAKLYNGMTSEAQLAALVNEKFQPVQESELNDREQDGTLMRVKTGKHVQCFVSVQTLAPAINCLLTIETKTGKPKKAEEPKGSS